MLDAVVNVDTACLCPCLHDWTTFLGLYQLLKRHLYHWGLRHQCTTAFGVFYMSAITIIICDNKWRVWILFCELYEHQI